MEAETAHSDSHQPKISQGEPLPEPALDARVRAVQAKQDRREVGQRVVKLGNVGRVRVIVLTPINRRSVVPIVCGYQRECCLGQMQCLQP
jgi:hypothetical protein